MLLSFVCLLALQCPYDIYAFALMREVDNAHMVSARRSPWRRTLKRFVDNASGVDEYLADRQLLEKVCENPGTSPEPMWEGMKQMAKALNSVKAPYFIEGGTVLALARNCSMFPSDVDFDIEYKWFMDHFDETVSAIHDAGFTTARTFGERNQIGYEASFKLKSGVNVDLFTILRTDHHINLGLWIKGKYHPCTANATGVIDFKWQGVDVKVPVPLTDYLVSLFGKGYMKPQKWRWNKEPFTVGSCREPA